MSEQTVVDITPKYTREQSANIQRLMDEKAHLEYLCFMMLKSMNEIPLRGLFELGLKHSMIDGSTFKEFFGGKEHCHTGCVEAEGHTVPSLLKEWHETTENMLKACTQQA